jgi:hypothetical protein
MAKEDGDLQVAYFFFDDKEDKQKTAMSCLSSLIHQLIFSAPQLIDHATKFFISQKEQMVDSIDRLWKIFTAIVTDQVVRGRYIILDALDECEEKSRTALLDKLKEWYKKTAKKSKTFLKVFSTSRQNTKVTATFKIDLETEDHNTRSDIKSFVANEVEELGYEGNFRKEVSTKLERGAGTMFLWASLVAQDLKDTPTRDVLETLEKIPPGIKGLYTHLLRRIPPTSVGIARMIFMNVVHAPRQMSVTELAIACSVEDSYTSLSSLPPYVLENFQKDIKLCGPILKTRSTPNTRKRLLSVTCHDSAEERESQDLAHSHEMDANTITEVQLVHQSAKEFILEASISAVSLFQSDPPGLMLHTPDEARRHLAITCLNYVAFVEFQTGKLRTNAATANTSSFELKVCANVRLARATGFLDFAAQSWIHLCQERDLVVWETFNRLAQLGKLKFAFKFHHDSRLENYSQTRVHTGSPTWDKYMKKRNVDADPVFLAIYFGIFAERILNDKSPEDLKSRPEILTLAAALGHSEVVKLLLSKGADINGRKGAALKGAVKQGRQDMISLLLTHGANVKPQYIESVEVTAKAGRRDLVEVLLKRGVNINAEDGKLIDMAFDLKWDEEIVLFLLQRCTYIEQRGTEYLDEAAALGYAAVAVYLLGHGVEVNKVTPHGSALCAAVLGRNLDVIKRLLAAGANVNYPSPLGCPLQLAKVAQSRWDEGHEIAATLVEYGATDEVNEEVNQPIRSTVNRTATTSTTTIRYEK